MGKHVVIVGSGTSGLVSALIIRAMFDDYNITIISSSRIGIIGVGEGSTEHWKTFQTACGIPVEEMLSACDATHKNGIYFENWSSNKDYMHSVSLGGDQKNTFNGTYAYCLSIDKPIYEVVHGVDFPITTIPNTEKPHDSVNQYHFDTVKLNSYLTNLAKNRNIKFIDGEVLLVNKNIENGYIESVTLKESNAVIDGDFFIDASGFSRVLMKELDNIFVDYSDYLLCDSAIAFPTPSDESGEIKPYTRAIALKNGWMWEIPTQSRRGNGYVFSSKFCSPEQAAQECSEIHKKEIIPAKTFKFKPGYYPNAWVKNCVGIGLSGSFVEPIEATSIGTSIQQSFLLCSYLSTFKPNNNKSIAEYNRIFASIMSNILVMVSMHYMTDRNDTDMWSATRSLKRPDDLTRLLELWQERCPEKHDVLSTGWELFSATNFWHIAQGQGLLNSEIAAEQLSCYNSLLPVTQSLHNYKKARMELGELNHAEALKKLKK